MTSERAEPDAQRREAQYAAFVRKTRNAARQCLFFLYDLQGLDLASVDKDARFALRQVRSIVDGVHIPNRFFERSSSSQETLPANERGLQDKASDFAVERDGEPKRSLSSDEATLPANKRGLRHKAINFVFERDVEPERLFQLSNRLLGERTIRQRLKAFLLEGTAGDVESQAPAGGDSVSSSRDSWRPKRDAAREQVFVFWTLQIWQRLRKIEQPSSQQYDQLILQFQAFLRITRPRDIAYFSMLVKKLGILLLRNVSVIFGLVALGLIWRQEVLASLVLNGGVRSILPFIAVLGVGTFSLAVGSLGRFGVGKRAFFRVAFPAEEPERGIDSWPESGNLRTRIGCSEIFKAGLMLAWFTIFGLAFWQFFDPTCRTLFVLAALSWSVLIALHWLDVWDFLDPRPIRFFVLVGLGALGFGVLTDRHCLMTYVVFGLLFVSWVFNVVRKRRFTLVGTIMAVLCCGIVVSVWIGHHAFQNATWRTDETSIAAVTDSPRAHAETTSNLSSFERVASKEWPFPTSLTGGAPAPVVVIAASGGGSRAAIYTALTLRALHRDLPRVADQIQAISSVSGGSLATAAYVARRYRDATEADLKVGTNWDSLVEDVSQDFLYPTLMGALKPSSSRGEEIQAYWDEHAGLKGLSLRELSNAWSESSKRARSASEPTHAPFPIPLFNACTLDGHAAVITPLESSAYLDPIDDASRVKQLRHWYAVQDDEELTWVQDRDVMYPLEALSTTSNPTLSQAVRASANFPFGFPLVDVETKELYGPAWVRRRSKLVSLTDGGVLSNSGLWTLFQLLTHDSHRENLVQRGVLLIVVDASKMPVYSADRRSLASLYGAIQDQDPLGQNLHRRMFELLFLVFGEAIQIVKLDLIPSVRDNVYTTWALDERSRAKLENSFDRVWSNSEAEARTRERIRQSWDELSKYAIATHERRLRGPASQISKDGEQRTPEPTPLTDSKGRASSEPDEPDKRPEGELPVPSDPTPGRPQAVVAAQPARVEGVIAAKWRASAASMLRPPLD